MLVSRLLRTSPSSSLRVVGLAAAGLLLSSACGPGDHSGQDPPKKEGLDAKAKAKADAEKARAAKEAEAAAKPAWTWTLPAGLSKPPEVPADNEMTAAKVALGHQLFMDKRLSGDGSRSCYSCHQNELGNADGRKMALGAGDKPLTRNTPTIWNVGYHAELYWDGRAAGLEKQMIGAWKGGNMGAGDDLDAKAAEIGGLPEYKAQFKDVFGLSGTEAVTPDHVAKAISAYERTLLCGETPYDTGELEGPSQRGWELFRDRGCRTCHDGDNFTDGKFHNVGISVGSAKKPGDIGRGKVSGSAEDNHKFRTPTLRNVAKTAPYFHDGSVATLKEAVQYMARGGDRKAPGIDPGLQDLKLTDAQLDDLVAFLEVLSCSGQLEVLGDQAVAGIPE
ncbi:MAG: c-type cytochrome [Myxococcales bacterium]|nr:c-type cytochrome [Myxococcales bacterium]